ncbi:sigma-54-dependent Fis family transcriptional regulator [uncultured Fusobacterium sp.]|uniref:sigma-54 interaction domain-containing protein n=1 Tax=uncultured Fusobacterium sp. TaxID=159267 RepID=UPI000BBA7BEB|nr:sigma 54-interacting transcriptional regulator [uncultured Fusobacterium sp.]BBA52784.1 putative transcriptional regulator [Fusobacterium varium]
MSFKNLPFNISLETIMKIIDNMYDEILIYDNRYNIVYINKACQRHYNCTAESMIGKSFFDFINKDNNSWDCSILPIVYKDRKPYAVKQKTFLGTELFTIAIPIFDEKNILKYVVMNVRDNTDGIKIYNPDYTYKDSIVKNIEPPKSNNIKMQELLKMIERIKNIDTPCILTGESGTGKTMLAKYIHSISDRANEPFVSLNCASIPTNLVESELFGYEKGAFTGANSKGKKGLFETANKGTLLLDEISELPLSAQSKLLHVLQEQKYLPIGGNKPIEIDVKIIAATNKDLRTLVFNKQFREDLYYRLNVIELYLPPLRERKEDISFLIKSFIEKFNKKYFFSKSFTKEALEILEAAQWKGNIRELQHAIERLMVTNDSSVIGVEHLSERLPNHSYDKNSIEEDSNISFDEKMNQYEASLIKEAYQKFKTSRKVAQYLKISQTKANKLIRKYINNNSL